MTADPLPRAADPAHLTEALRRSDALGDDARVSSVVVASSRATILSTIIRLNLSYEGAAADAPRPLILKTGLPERTDVKWNAGRHEVAFYTQVAAAMTMRLAPRYFEAVGDAGNNAWHLLLEDSGRRRERFSLEVWQAAEASSSPPARATIAETLQAQLLEQRRQRKCGCGDDGRLFSDLRIGLIDVDADACGAAILDQ